MKKAIIYVLICVGLWALIPVVAKLGQIDLDNHQFLFWSSLVSLISMMIATLIAKKHREIFNYKINDWAMATGLGFLGTYLLLHSPILWLRQCSRFRSISTPV